MGVDRLLDMMRTADNVNGDGIITMIVAHGEDISQWMCLMIQMQGH